MGETSTTTTDNSVFEGLFHRALELTPALKEKLCEVGYNPARPEVSYPTAVWRQALEVARHELYPALPREAGLAMLGRRMIDGFLGTFSGKVIGALLPLIGTAGLVKRWPRFYSAGRKGVAVTVTFLEGNSADIRFEDRESLPDFVLGVLEAASVRTGHPLKATVASHTPEGYVLHVVW